MTSKEALNKMSDYIGRLGGGETLEEEEIISQALEVLEILKKYLFIRIMDIPAFDGTYIVSLLDKEDREWDYTCIFVNEEEKEKIKEWLEKKEE